MTETIQIACAACGHAAELPASDKRPPTAIQCPMCGTWIRDFAAEVEAAGKPAPESDGIEESVKAVAYLVASDSKTLEQQYPLHGAKTIVGRENADVSTGDPTMSVHHFEIEKRDGEFYIRDLDSTNHTKVNGQKIKATTLKSGDRIQAGLTFLVFLAK